MSSFDRKLRRFVNKYKEEFGKDAIDPSEVARWAIREGLYEPQEQDIVRILARLISRALRAAYFVDPQGRKVRTNHVVVENKGGTQIAIWRDIRTAPRDHVKKSMQQRRRQIKGDCCRLKTDLDSYNDNLNSGVQIELSFDFTNDLKESELMRTEALPLERKPRKPAARPPRLRRFPTTPSTAPAT